jgi:hypothetical protein
VISISLAAFFSTLPVVCAKSVSGATRMVAGQMALFGKKFEPTNEKRANAASQFVLCAALA